MSGLETNTALSQVGLIAQVTNQSSISKSSEERVSGCLGCIVVIIIIYRLL